MQNGHDPIRQDDSWTLVAKLLHWLMAALILAQLALGKYAESIALSPQKLNLMVWHKSIGIVLLLLVLIRLTWAVVNPRPSPVDGIGVIMRKASKYSHFVLYLLMLSIPLSGWLMNSAKNIPFSVFRTIPWPNLIGPDKKLAVLFEQLHEGLVNILGIVLVIHVLAALWHHFYRQDRVLTRMWFGKSDR